MQVNSVARSILEARYLEPGETPEGMVERVARAVASDKKRIDDYAQLMDSLDFLPNTPTLINAGRPGGQLQACFVLPLSDSMHDIFTTLYNMSMIQKTGGGVGFPLSNLRPKGAPVTSTRGASSGPLSFLKIFNAASEEVEQGGARRGANMACMKVNHPDIESFITCKDVEGTLENFNISVLINKAFLDMAANGQDMILEHGGQNYGIINAAKLFDKIIYQAHKNGEPGIIFIDRINEEHTAKHLGIIESTNPCGEQPLLPFEACNLGSINVAHMLKYSEDKYPELDCAKINKTARIATRFLNDVIDANTFPLTRPDAAIEHATLLTRKIGLGIMGLGTMFTRMNIPYGSTESLMIAEKLMSEIQSAAWDESCAIAEKDGPYPGFPYDSLNEQERRNATLTTIAPTGSLATIAGVSYGCEPIFGLKYQKEMMGQTHTLVNADFDMAARVLYELGSYTEVLDKVLEKGSCQDIEELPEEIRKVWRTATEIPWEQHVLMQAALQRHVDNAVSKTINMPADCTADDIKSAIESAYEKGCKGLTIYRAGSREKEAISFGTADKECLTPSGRGKRLYGFTDRIPTGCGKLYVTVNSRDAHPLETFIEPGSDGGCEAYGNALSRSISIGLRAGVDPKEYVRQLRKVSCKNFLRKAANGDLEGKSCPDVVGRVLQSALKHTSSEGMEEPIRAAESGSFGVPCPNPTCGATLESAEGCWVCSSCGFNKC